MTINLAFDQIKDTLDTADQKDRNIRIKYQIQSCVEFLDVAIQNDNISFSQPNRGIVYSSIHIRSSTSCSSQYSICCFATSRSHLFQCARLHYRTHSNRYVSAIERLSTRVHYQAYQSILRPIQCSIGVKTTERTRLLSVTSEGTPSTDSTCKTTKMLHRCPSH